MIELELFELVPPVNAVHDLEWSSIGRVLLKGALFEERHELAGLFLKAELEKGEERE